MSTAIVTFCEQGVGIGRRLSDGLGEVQMYVHASVKGRVEAKRFKSVMALAAKLFQRYRSVIFIAPCGLVVRAIAPHLQHKTTDPAVVVVDAGGRYAVSL